VVIIVHAQELELHLRQCRRHVVCNTLRVGPMLQDAPVRERESMCIIVIIVCVCV
jgi:hypothetical protein